MGASLQVQHIAGTELKIQKCEQLKKMKMVLTLQVQHAAGMELKIDKCKN